MSGSDEYGGGVGTIRVFHFGGKSDEDFGEFMSKAKAIATGQGWADVFKSSYDPTTGANKKIEAKGIMYFTLDCTGKALKVIQHEATTKDMIAKLTQRYKETETTGYLQLSKKFLEMRMSIKDDPDDWFLELEELNLKMKSIKASYEKGDEELKIKVLTSLPGNILRW